MVLPEGRIRIRIFFLLGFSFSLYGEDAEYMDVHWKPLWWCSTCLKSVPKVAFEEIPYTAAPEIVYLVFYSWENRIVGYYAVFIFLLQ